MEVTDDQIRERLKDLLRNVDLQTTTERQIRKMLQEEFGADLSDKKAIIRGEIEAYLDEQAANDVQEKTGSGNAETAEGDDEAEVMDEDDDVNEDDGSDEEARPAKKGRGGGGGGGSVLSEALAAFLGVESMARTQVVKAIWAYIKEHNLQDPSNKRNIRPDEKLGTVLKAPVTMFSMNKQLSKHIGGSAARDDSSDDGGSGDDEERPQKKKAPKKRKKAEKGEGSSAPNGFTKAFPVSEKMAAWLGKSEISRPELTSFFWKYIKDNGLQDPDNKKMVICDDALRDLTGEDRFLAFGFAKYMKQHINPQDA